MRLSPYDVQIRETESKIYVELWVDRYHCLHTDYDKNLNMNCLDNAVYLRDGLLKMSSLPTPVINKVDSYYRVVIHMFKANEYSYIMHSEKVNLKTAMYIRDRLMGN